VPKEFLLFTTLDAAIVTTPKVFAQLKKRFRALAPFLDFLNARGKAAYAHPHALPKSMNPRAGSVFNSFTRI
jgi:hypothetical protein